MPETNSLEVIAYCNGMKTAQYPSTGRSDAKDFMAMCAVRCKHPPDLYSSDFAVSSILCTGYKLERPT